jgi:hypothetical protein
VTYLAHLPNWRDMGKMAFFKDIWEQGKMVVVWIRGHQAFAAKFGKLTRKSLLLPGTVRGICYIGANELTLFLYRRYAIWYSVHHAQPCNFPGR